MMNKEGVTMTSDVKAPRLLSLGPGRHSGEGHIDQGGRRFEARVLHGKPATSAVGVKGLNDYTKVDGIERRHEGAVLRL